MSKNLKPVWCDYCQACAEKRAEHVMPDQKRADQPPVTLPEYRAVERLPRCGHVVSGIVWRCLQCEYEKRQAVKALVDNLGPGSECSHCGGTGRCTKGVCPRCEGTGLDWAINDLIEDVRTAFGLEKAK